MLFLCSVDQLNLLGSNPFDSIYELRELALKRLPQVIEDMNIEEAGFIFEEENVSDYKDYIKKMKQNKTYFELPGIRSLALQLGISIRIYSVNIANSTMDDHCIVGSNGDSVVNVIYSGKCHYDSLHPKDCSCDEFCSCDKFASQFC